jgi:outer membrane protein OmpA-like peptidoglycan-associated protein
VLCSNEEHALNRRIQFTVTDISQQINFEKGSNVISPDDKLMLVKIGRYLREFKDTTIEIGGHADGGSGTEFVNNNISALRAERVFEFLKKNGFDVENLTHHGYGASQPIYHDVRDRRIEFLVHHNKRSK